MLATPESAAPLDGDIKLKDRQTLIGVELPVGGAPAGADRVASIVALPSRVAAQASDQFLTDGIPNTISAADPGERSRDQSSPE